MAIKSIKVWHSNSGEQRVYVKDDNGFESVEYVSGNNWNAAGSRAKQGKWGISEDDWKEAEELAKQNGTWTNWPIATEPTAKSGRWVCGDCGSPYCSGPNCTSNR